MCRGDVALPKASSALPQMRTATENAVKWARALEHLNDREALCGLSSRRSHGRKGPAVSRDTAASFAEAVIAHHRRLFESGAGGTNTENGLTCLLMWALWMSLGAV